MGAIGCIHRVNLSDFVPNNSARFLLAELCVPDGGSTRLICEFYVNCWGD